MKKFNILAIGAIQICVFFVTGLFFLGSQENYIDLLEELPEAFFNRLAAGAIIGIFGSVFVAIGNWILNMIRPDNRKVRVLRSVVVTFSLSLVTSVIGTSWFFFR